MEKVHPVWVDAWLARRAAAERKRVIVVHDLFTDKNKGPVFKAEELALPKPVEVSGKTVAFILTTREHMADMIGSVLSSRASLKRPAVVSASPLVAKKSKK